MTHYPDIVRAAWKGYDSSRTINTIEDISPMVSTNRVYKVTFQDEDFIIAKLSTFGQYEHFKEDHRIIQSLSNNLLYPLKTCLPKAY